MIRRLLGVSLVAGIALVLSCGSSEARTEFKLPSGNVENGKAAFAEMGCKSCHAVLGHDFKPIADPPVPVELGAKWGKRSISDAELVTSIISPSHVIASDYPEELIKSGGISRMGYPASMKVQELVDIIAFLRSVQEAARGR